MDTLHGWKTIKHFWVCWEITSALFVLLSSLVSVYGHDLNVEMPSVQALASRDISSLEMINKTAGLDITVWLGSSGGGTLG